MPAAVDQGGEPDLRVAPPDVQRPDAFRRVNLMAAEAEQVDRDPRHVDRDLADGLRGVGVEDDPALVAEPADLGHGLIVPTSLLAAMTETRTVRSVSAASMASADTIPHASGATTVRSQPSRASRLSGSSTALCSVAAVTRWFPFRLRAGSTPLIARLLASVAPEVKTISLGSAPIKAATCSRARSTASAASQPNRCETLAALP